MICYDFECISCFHKFEELLSKDEEYPKCPECKGNTEKCIGQTPSFHSPKHWEMKRKATLMRNKITGRTPWRKSSESQTD